MGALNGKLAFVTGGASGLGETIARAFATEGAAVVIADIDVAGGEALAADIGARFVQLDVTQETSWAQAVTPFDRIDVLVNNAGITTLGSVEDLTLAQFRHELDIDVLGVFMGIQAALPRMKAHGGSIINMSSLSGVKASANLCAYNAAKAAVTHMTKSCALHFAEKGYGIRCNSIHPGAIHTPIIDKVLAQSNNPQALYQSFVDVHPVGRLGKPEEIAAMAVFLASDASAFATGAEFRVDGGASI
ncbi:MAG: glucose 1-dehydrogenase [Novosphingobium sp.]|uniref:glucose 1-dehydrogenase n=1 Tax=Novosphingobium sp. TaxID=1874826 RepID=UPI002734BBFD|nr:glucose 1-dehydrogenase [Novosphingobium sp.]MDP3549917.1 glucose 1-dehydrogenase [Novosphingobium sp.]